MCFQLIFCILLLVEINKSKIKSKVSQSLKLCQVNPNTAARFRLHTYLETHEVKQRVINDSSKNLGFHKIKELFSWQIKHWIYNLFAFLCYPDQGIIDWTGTETWLIFSRVCNSEKNKELFVPALNGITASVRCVSSKTVVLNAKLLDWLRRA